MSKPFFFCEDTRAGYGGAQIHLCQGGTSGYVEVRHDGFVLLHKPAGASSVLDVIFLLINYL